MRPLPVLLAALLLAAGAPPCAAEPERLIGGQVESLLEFARTRHPEFAALRAEAEAAAARIEPAGALPDPVLRTELRNVTNEGSDASGNLLPPRIGSARYTFSQSLPWFGKRDLRRDVAGAGADEAQARARAGWIDLATRIKLTYAQHHVHLTSIRYTQENLDLMRRVAEIARTRYASGFGSQQDALRAQIRDHRHGDRPGHAGRRERPGQRAHARAAGPPGKRQAAPAGKAACCCRRWRRWTWSRWKRACVPTIPSLRRTTRASPARRRAATWWSATAIPT
jgi:cobalt-zinc-cadmium efflux system outer membrane protein